MDVSDALEVVKLEIMSGRLICRKPIVKITVTKDEVESCFECYVDSAVAIPDLYRCQPNNNKELPAMSVIIKEIDFLERIIYLEMSADYYCSFLLSYYNPKL